MVRVSVSSIDRKALGSDLADYGEIELKNLTNEVANEFLATAIKVVSVDPTRIEPWGNDKALVISYTRRSPSGGLMGVTQYKILTTRRLVELTLTRRLSGQQDLTPTIEHIKKSFRY